MIPLAFGKTRILVVGDSMLDVYVSGKVSRISPEAPVPVVEKESSYYCLGGAANTAANVVSLGSKAVLYSAVGELTRDKVVFREMLQSLSIPLWEAFMSGEDSLTRKTRIVGNSYQIVRLDEDKLFDWQGKETPHMERLFSRVSAGMGDISSIILSDYGKGFLSWDVCRSLISMGEAIKIPVFVDPKDGDWKKYSGAYCVKPNLYELSKQAGCLISSIEDIKKYGCELIEEFSFSSLLVTMGDQGMILLQKEEPTFMHFRPYLVEVSDVSGAGDTAMAVLAACCSVGLPLTAAAHFANKAAAAVVSRKGTQLVRYSDIHEEDE